MQEKKIKIYSSKDWVTGEKNILVLLWPFWIPDEQNSTDPDSGRFKEYTEKGKELFELVDIIEDADFTLYPQEYTDTDKCKSHIKTVSDISLAKGKKLIVYYNSDNDEKLDLPNCIIFRTSFYKSTQPANEFALPGWSVDFAKFFPAQKFIPLTDVKTPFVSYCGYVDYETQTLKNVIKSILRPPVKNQEHFAKARRGKACRILKKNDGIKTSFIIRKGFWAQGIEDKQKAREEYAYNMINSLYGIVTRGGGNFSYRFYEMLSCGRIPVFINTDSVLPFDHIIDWKKYVVWVEEHELSRIDEILLKYHSGKTKEQLIEQQNSNRKLYEEFISPYGFHSKLSLILDQFK